MLVVWWSAVTLFFPLQGVGYNSVSTRLCFNSCMNSRIPACRIPDLLSCTTIIPMLWLEMSSCYQHPAIGLMPLLARRISREHRLHKVISLIGGAPHPYPFCLVEGWHCHKLLFFLSASSWTQSIARSHTRTSCVLSLPLDTAPLTSYPCSSIRGPKNSRR